MRTNQHFVDGASATWDGERTPDLFDPSRGEVRADTFGEALDYLCRHPSTMG